VKQRNQIAIIVPAYNESENLKILLPGIRRAAPGAQIFVVDDSADKEHRKLENLVFRLKDPGIRIITRESKQGRGSAVMAGLREAFKDSRIKRFIEMDADLAHDPAEIPDFLKQADETDLVIGSRYIEGSRITDWPLRRLIQSRMINFFLKYLLGLNITDYTNGYRMYSRRAVSELMRTPPLERGFIALSEIAYILKKRDLRITEIPVTFTDRRYGRSNAGFSELMGSLFGVLRIRFINDYTDKKRLK
jgi:dolichol-phosphate mannosyltransferase